MASDLKYAWRSVRAHPASALLSVLILGLGIGAAIAAYATAQAVFFQPLPYLQPDRVVFVWDGTKQRPMTNLTPGRLIDLRERARTLDVAGIGHLSMTLTGHGLPERLPGASVSSNFFDVLGVAPALGRLFHTGDASRRQVVLSDALWRTRFGADPQLVGSTLALDGVAHTVAGVLPRTFYWTSITVRPSPGPHPEIFVIAPDNEIPRMPAPRGGDPRHDRRTGYLRAVARLRGGATIDAARGEIAALSLQMEREYPATDRGRSAILIPARDQLLGSVREPILLLLGATGLLLAAACANVANLQLMRLAARTRDLLVHAAIGADRRRLGSQLLIEALILALAGGVLGIAIGTGVLAVVTRLVPVEVPRLATVAIDWRVAMVACGIATVCAVSIALLPLGRIGRGSLSIGDRSRTAGASPRARRVIVAAEVATAVVLISGAMLFGRSFAQLQRVDVGIADVDRLLTFNLVLAGDRAALPPVERVAFYRQVLDRIHSIPGVERASSAATLPIGGDEFGSSVVLEGRDPDDAPAVGYQVVGPGWFATLGVPLLRGRDFHPADTAAVMVNQAFADAFWPGQDPVGRRLKTDRDGDWMTVVGVVGNLRHLGPSRPPRPELYDDESRRSFSFTAMAVRTTGDPLAIVERIRQEVAALDPGQPISAVATMGAHLRRAQAEMRLLWSITVAFGVLSLAVAALGVYGAIGFSVAQRTREFGVRLALGASPLRLGRQIVGEALSTTCAGVTIGVGLAAGAAALMRSLLFATAPTDIVSHATAATALMAAGALAALVPARRAMRADPAIALRAE